MRYLVELREYTESGDYIENDYTFKTRNECIEFARKNRSNLYAAYDYEDRNYDPIHLNI